MEIIDLSLPIFTGMPFSANDRGTTISTRHVDPGWTASSIDTSCHGGTHVECAAHAVEGGRTLDTFPLSAFMGEAQCIRREDIGKASVNSEVLLIHTGYDSLWPQDEYTRTTLGLTPEEAQWISSKKLKAVGNDTTSIGGVDIHRIIFTSGSLVIESMCNLKEVLGKQFKVYFLPLRIGVEASPTRAVAILD
jgi:arylformamidase